MSKEDKQRFIEEVTEKFLADMTMEEKQKIVSNIMEKFFANMTTEDKQKIMAEIAPQVMEGFDTTVIMPQMLMAMMGLGQQKDGMSGIMPIMASVKGSTKKFNKPKTKDSEEA
jgi:hypothetical protein